MPEKKIIQESNPFKRESINNQTNVKNIYWGEVLSIKDSSEGGIIKVRIPELDSKLPDANVPEAYPMLPKFFHLYPQIGEVVRVFISDPQNSQRSRFWMGSVISQLQKVKYDGVFTALNTTNIGRSAPEKSVSQYPEAKGIYPTVTEIGLIGRNNTDVLLKDREVLIRAGKHEMGDVLKLNRNNPATLNLIFEDTPDGESATRSTSMLLGDIIMLIAHSGNPKFKATNFSKEDRDKMIEKGHPLGRGDVLVKVLEIFRKAIINHVHPYDTLPSDKSGIIVDLEKLNLDLILQKNILIN